MSKIILSTDIGSDPDDGLALLTMINSGMDIAGIYVVNGRVDARAYIAKHIVNLSGKKIPVAIGESRALEDRINPFSSCEEDLIPDAFVEDITGKDLVFTPLEKAGIIKNGAEDLAKKLSKEKHVVFSIGPLTDIAKLLKENSDAAKNIEKLYIMGGSITGRLEHNFRFDPLATKLVLNSDLPLTIIPGDVCDKYKMSTDILKQLKSPAGKFTKTITKGYMGWQTATKFERKIDGLEYNVEGLLRTRPPTTVKTLSQEESQKLIDMGEFLFNNLGDYVFAAMQPDIYFKQLGEFIQHLKSPNIVYNGSGAVALIVEGFIPKSLSVADVYVPYAFLTPDKLKIKKIKMNCSEEGKTILGKGKEHQVVTDLDFNDFEKFLRKYLK